MTVLQEAKEQDLQTGRRAFREEACAADAEPAGARGRAESRKRQDTHLCTL